MLLARVTQFGAGAALVAVAVAAGCSTSSKYDELFDELAAACAEAPTNHPLARGAQDGPRPDARAVTVAVTLDGVTVSDRSPMRGSTDDTLRVLHDDIEHALDEQVREGALSQAERETPIIALAVAPDVPASRVAEVLRRLKLHGFHTFQLVLGRPAIEVHVPDPAYVEEVGRLVREGGAANASRVLGEELKPLAEVCAPVFSVFAEVAVVPPEARCKALSDGLREALPQCPWRFESDKVMSIAAMTIADPARSIPVAHAVEMEWSATPVEFPGDQRWGDWGPTWLESRAFAFAPRTASVDPGEAALAEQLCHGGYQGIARPGARESSCYMRCLDGQESSCERLLEVASKDSGYRERLCERDDVVACAIINLTARLDAAKAWIEAGEAKLIKACEGGRASACDALARHVYGKRSMVFALQDEAKASRYGVKSCELKGEKDCSAAPRTRSR